MKRKFIFSTLLLVLQILKAQDLIPYTSEGKFGFKDQSGKLLTPAIYHSYSKNEGNLYKVKTGDKYGIIDSKGKTKVKPIYKFINNFKDGIAPAQREDGVYGIIDVNGTEKIFNYRYLSSFTDGGAVASLKGQEKFGVVDVNGKTLIDFKYDNIIYRGNSVGMTHKDYGKVAYIGLGSEEITPYIYDGGNKIFAEGLMAVSLDGKHGYIDKAGKIVIPIMYERASSFHNGVALIMLDKKMKMIDRTGKIIRDLPYEEMGRHIMDGKIPVWLNDKMGIIEMTTGKVVIEPLYDDITIDRSTKYWAKKDNKYGIIDKNGKTVLPHEFSEVNSTYGGNENSIVVKDGKYGMYDADKNEILAPVYDSISKNGGNGFVMTKMGSKYGFIDLLGKELAHPQFDSAKSFSDGVAVVFSENKFHILYPSGTKKTVSYKGSSDIQMVENFNSGLAIVIYMNKYGLMSKNGDFIVSPLYQFIGEPQFDVRLTAIADQFGLLDLSGNTILEPKYDKIDVVSDYTIIKATLGDVISYFDKKGNRVSEPDL
ncbi:WG repeat-containing protein [Chryseobacterium caseinilyticum]|uniref:WG repeat-containing protein n=1 Tax=Chryseobacterium caseinilyticum TaxID=2771428 RepID=A0ABR8ZAK5_9FLAO|nr:WG repeat-containing protein [Chryseobacterium caseinilyticum]MBD8082340.1 WG repeat-containing protein [Chryseobacterium caseinilyticum]